MKYNKQAFSTVYVFLLIAMMTLLWVMVLNKQSFLEKSREIIFLQNLFAKSLQTDVGIFEKLYEVNQTGALLQKSGIILQNTWFQNIFWSNEKVKESIQKSDFDVSPNKKLSQIGTWVIYLDINQAFSGKIITFDTNLFSTSGKLVKKSEFLFDRETWGIGYLHTDGTLSSGTWNLFEMNFWASDPAIFLAYNTWEIENLRYTLEVREQGTFSPVYIAPVNTQWTQREYLGNGIFESFWTYIYFIQKILK